MTLFHSLHLHYEQEDDQALNHQHPWPPVFRDGISVYNPEDYTFSIGIENQHAKTMKWKQLLALPTFNESRRITSMAGWTYYGHWKGITFQTLFSLFSTPQLYPWVRLESLDGQHTIIDRASLSHYRVLAECDGKPFSPLYGGPLWVHHFDQYVEYAFFHLKNITLLQGEHLPYHPRTELGYTPEKARVQPGRYYAIHHEKMANL